MEPEPLTLIKIKEAVEEVAEARFAFAMSEADVELCVSTVLREKGCHVIEQLPIIPSWRTKRGRPVHLYARRVDLSVRFGDETPILVELKVATRIEENYRSQARAYSLATGFKTVLAFIEKNPASRAIFEVYDAPDPDSVYLKNAVV